MAQYHFNEGVIEIQNAGVIDRSTTALELPVGDKRISLVITRTAPAPQDLKEAAEETLDTLGVSFRRFRPSPAVYSEWSGHKAAELEFTWIHDAGPMFNKVALVLSGPGLLSITVAGTEELRASVVKTFETVKASMKFRRPT